MSSRTSGAPCSREEIRSRYWTRSRPTRWPRPAADEPLTPGCRVRPPGGRGPAGESQPGSPRATPARTPDRPRAGRRGRDWPALLWLGPSLALIAGVVLYPAIHLVRASLGRYSVTGLHQGWVGLEHYAALLREPALPAVVLNTAVWVGAVVGITLAISLGLAQLLDQPFPGRRLVRWALI